MTGFEILLSFYLFAVCSTFLCSFVPALPVFIKIDQVSFSILFHLYLFTPFFNYTSLIIFIVVILRIIMCILNITIYYELILDNITPNV